ncbi:MAG: hypothetical protein ACREK3_06730 [Gemmatimonadota bacterium]
MIEDSEEDQSERTESPRGTQRKQDEASEQVREPGDALRTLARQAEQFRVPDDTLRKLARQAEQFRVPDDTLRKLAAISSRLPLPAVEAADAPAGAAPRDRSAAELTARRAAISDLVERSQAAVLRPPAPPDPGRARPADKGLTGHAPPGPGWLSSRDGRRVRRSIREAKSLDLLILAADIRRSTILMKETVDAYKYASILGDFIEKARQEIWQHGGLFDKFTGDGLLAFWTYAPSGRDAVIRKALNATQDILVLFHDVTLPQFLRESSAFPGGLGISVGLDIGSATLVSMADQLTVVGPPVVGAVRMVNTGDSPWETVANVHLGAHLETLVARGDLRGVTVTSDWRTTKEYEEQLAYVVEFTDLVLE